MENFILRVVSGLTGRSALLTYNTRLRFTNKPTSTCKPTSLSGQRCPVCPNEASVRLKATGVEVVNLTDQVSLVSRSIYHCFKTIKKDAILFKNCVLNSRAFRLSGLPQWIGVPTSPKFQIIIHLFRPIFFPLTNKSINHNFAFVK